MNDMKGTVITAIVAVICLYILIAVASIKIGSLNQKISSIRAIAQYNQDYVDYSWHQAIAIIDGEEK